MGGEPRPYILLWRKKLAVDFNRSHKQLHSSCGFADGNADLAPTLPPPARALFHFHRQFKAIASVTPRV
jgi:hypothetical protein